MHVGTEVEYAIAHRLMDYVGKCASLHGHNYRIIIEGNFPELPIPILGVGLAMDFKDIKMLLASILDPFDHASMLREDDSLVEHLRTDARNKVLTFPWNPTAENFATYLQSELTQRVPIAIWSVRVYETSKSYAEATYR